MVVAVIVEVLAMALVLLLITLMDVDPLDMATDTLDTAMELTPSILLWVVVSFLMEAVDLVMDVLVVVDVKLVPCTMILVLLLVLHALFVLEVLTWLTQWTMLLLLLLLPLLLVVVLSPLVAPLRNPLSLTFLKKTCFSDRTMPVCPKEALLMSSMNSALDMAMSVKDMVITEERQRILTQR